MSTKVTPKKKPRKICDPAMCDHCIYLGEGDFVCTLHGLDPDNTVFVMDDWTPTEFYLQCVNDPEKTSK